MKIRCGSHQQNRSIVRPGLSLMATKVALTAEEFRENSQRSIALFNTEKLSTDSTHVLKSAYCILCISAVAICTGRVEAKVRVVPAGGNRDAVAICTGRVEAKCEASPNRVYRAVAICTGRVEAKLGMLGVQNRQHLLQSARSVWRQSEKVAGAWREITRCNLHGACRETERHHPTKKSEKIYADILHFYSS